MEEHVFDSYEEFKSAVRVFKEKNNGDVYFEPEDAPKRLLIGVKAITDNGEEMFFLRIAGFRRSQIPDDDRKVYLEYLDAKAALNNATEKYINVLVDQVT